MTENTSIPDVIKYQDINISLYKMNNTENIYYYFRFNKKTYRGTTKTKDKDKSISYVQNLVYQLLSGKEIKQKPIPFDKTFKSFLKSHKKKVKPITIKNYTYEGKYLILCFKNQDIREMYKYDVYKEFINWKLNLNPKSFGNVSRNRSCSLIRLFLDYCLTTYRKELEGLKLPRYKHIPETPRLKTLTDEQYNLIEKYYMGTSYEYNWYVIDFIRNTGLRFPSEMYKLQWKHVHLEEKFIKITNRKNPNNVYVETDVPLVPKSIEILKKLKSRQKISTTDEDFVFVNNKGKHIKDISLSFKRVQLRIGIEKEKTVGMYSHRHWFVNSNLQKGIPIKYISLVMGHSSVGTVERNYSSLKSNEIKDKYLDYFKEKTPEIKEMIQDKTEHPEISKSDKEKLKQEILTSLLSKIDEMIK